MIKDARAAHLLYWRDALVEAALRSIKVDPKDVRSRESIETLIGGRISDRARIEELFAAFAQRVSSDDREKIVKVPVKVCLLAYQGTGKDKDTQYGCIWLPGELSRDGTLSPVDAGPWVVRQALNPTDYKGPILGEYDMWETFANSVAYKAADWKEAIDHIVRFMRAVRTGSLDADEPRAGNGEEHSPPDLHEFLPTLEGFERLEFGFLILSEKDAPDAVRSFTDIYDVLIENRYPSSVVEKLLAKVSGSERGEPRPLPDPRKAAPRHVGQMGLGAPLNPQQRDAVHAYLDLAPGEILAINGPPGTGKTSLLKSVIATSVTSAARNDEPMPVIVVTSTNNQAVTNVIDDMMKAVPKSDDPLLSRWLPDIGSYGFYLPSQAKLEEAQKKKYPILADAEEKAGDTKWLETADEFWGACFESWAKEGGFRFPEARSDQLNFLATRLEACCVEIAHAFETLLPQVAAGSDGALQSIRASLAEQENLIEVAAAELQGLKDVARDAKRAREALRSEWEAKRIAWLSSMPSPTFLEALLWFLPPIAAGRATRVAALAANAGLDIGLDRDWRDERSVKSAVSDLIRFKGRGPTGGDFDEARATEIRQVVEAASGARDACRERIAEKAAAREAALAALIRLGLTRIEAELAPEQPRVLSERLDEKRVAAFALAMRLMEGRMIRDQRKSRFPKLKNGPKGAQKKWRTLAVFAPCIVMTLHQLTRNFMTWEWQKGTGEGDSYSSKFVPDLIDTLLIDEAGQVASALAVPALAFAQRCLMVGDVYQLEPIVSTTEGMDRLSAERRGIDETAFEALSDAGGATETGSAMKLARFASALSQPDEQGVMLVDHYRSVCDVIRYSNTLVYGGRLNPKRGILGEDQRVQLPQGPMRSLSYAHIESPVGLRSGSWSNPGEANAIAGWLAQNAAAISAAYGGSELSELVAVVTPFAGQRIAVREAVGRLLGSGIARRMTIDTIHSLQGAQRPIVIMSPTVTAKWKLDTGRRPFFDRGPNMMNVMVSRAQDAFLVFGDMYLFQDDGTKWPSSVLAGMLYERPDQRLEIEPGIAFVEREEIERISDLEGHRRELATAMSGARDEVVIVSPQISANAIEQDKLVGAIQAAREQDIGVLVYTDDQLDQRDGVLADHTRKGRDALVRAGAEVIVVRRLHAKTLIQDDAVIVEGSFNWLSATRDPTSQWHRLESSLRYSGLRVRELADHARKTLRSLPGERWAAGTETAGARRHPPSGIA